MAQAKEVRGPGPRGMGPKPKVENPGLLLKRIMGEVFRHYLPHCILVLVCIVGATGNGTLMWDISDTLNGMMAIPNLIGLLLLSNVIIRSTNDYFKKH